MCLFFTFYIKILNGIRHTSSLIIIYIYFFFYWAIVDLFTYIIVYIMGFLVAQLVNNPAMQETWVQSLCWEDPLEKEMATHAWRIPWTEEPGGLQSMRSQIVRQDWAINTFTSLKYNFIHKIDAS